MKKKILTIMAVVIVLLMFLITLIVLTNKSEIQKNELQNQIIGFWDCVKIITYDKSNNTTTEETPSIQKYTQIFDNGLKFYYDNDDFIEYAYYFEDDNTMVINLLEMQDVSAKYKIHFEESNLVMEREDDEIKITKYYSRKGV